MEQKPYMPMKKEVFDGQLREWGILEPQLKGKVLHDMRYLADGTDYVVVYSGNKGLVSIISSYALGNPYKILKAISEAFNINISLEPWVGRKLGIIQRIIKTPTITRPEHI